MEKNIYYDDEDILKSILHNVQLRMCKGSIY